MKRFFDITIVIAAAPIWLPLFALTAIAVLLAEGRPIFFRQIRAGRGGRPFRITKFRTMRDGNGPDEERLGRFGRFLRASSLDELPELFHVLIGTMSIVGPRPLPIEYLTRYNSEQARRHEIRPGITGWAQVHGRNNTTWEERLSLDIWYVDHRSAALDFKILLMTAAMVFTARGISRPGYSTMDEFKGSKQGETK